MEGGHAGEGQPPPPFDRQGAQQLVLGGLSGPVGIPTTKFVVGDAAYPRRKAREVKGKVPGKGRLEGLGQQERPEGIELEAASQVVAVHLEQPLFRLKGPLMQQAGRADHQPQGLEALQGQRRERLQAGVITEIEPPGSPFWSGGMHLQPRCALGQAIGQGLADAASPHHQRMALPVEQIRGLWFHKSSRVRHRLRRQGPWWLIGEHGENLKMAHDGSAMPNAVLFRCGRLKIHGSSSHAARPRCLGEHPGTSVERPGPGGAQLVTP